MRDARFAACASRSMRLSHSRARPARCSSSCVGRLAFNSSMSWVASDLYGFQKRGMAAGRRGVASAWRAAILAGAARGHRARGPRPPPARSSDLGAAEVVDALQEGVALAGEPACELVEAHAADLDRGQ